MLQFKQTKIQEFLSLGIRHIDHLNVERLKMLYEELDDNDILEEARLNGVASIIGHTLTKILDDPEDIPSHWQNEYDIIALRISKYMSELEKVATLLSEHNIDLLALKNSGITIGLYPHYGACPMGDVDVLVSKKNFRQAHALLTEHGYTLKFRSPLEEVNIQEAELGGGAEYSVQLEDGEHLWFELQWRPVAGRWIQPEQEPKVDDLIERSVAIDNSKVRLLSPEDNLIQVSLHTAKHTFVRAPGFRLHTDVDRVVTEQPVDWDIFVERVKTLKTKTAVFFSLAMAKSLLGTEIPDSVLYSIKPSNWKVKLMTRWLDKVCIYYPDERKFNKYAYIIFVSLLYDDFNDFLKGIFPPSSELKEKYEFQSNWLVPYYHVRRILNLLLKRVST